MEEKSGQRALVKRDLLVWDQKRFRHNRDFKKLKLMLNSIGLQVVLNPRQQFVKKLARCMFGAVRKMECLEGYSKMFLPHLPSRPVLIISRTKIDIEIKNILDQTGFKLTNKAIRTSNGGWNSLVVEDTDSPMTSFPTISANAARARRKNNRILATLPPLTKTLDKEVLDEMRKIIHR